MKNSDKPVKFEELYPDYPVQKVKKMAYLPGVAEGLVALTAIVLVALGLFYVLSKVQIPVPQSLLPKPPPSEDEMMAALPAEKLFEIAVNCLTVDDKTCAQKVFSHLLKVNPEFINADKKRKKIVSEASLL